MTNVESVIQLEVDSDRSNDNFLRIHYSPKIDEAYIPKNKIVQIKIRYSEDELARRVKSLGEKWNREKKV